MKNIKVSMKLIIAFLVVIFFSIAVGMVGIIGMNSIQKADRAMYDTNYMPSIMAGDVSQQVVEQRTFVRNYVIYDATLDAELFASNEAGLLANEAEMEELLPQYEAMISNPLDQEVFDEFSDVYHNDWLPILNAVTEAGRNNDTEGAKAILNTAVQIAASLDELTTRMQQINLDDGLLAVQANARLFNTMTIVEVAVLVVAVIFALFMAFYLTSLIAKPLLPLAAFMKQAGTTGNITLNDEDMQVISSYGKAKDEIGQTIAAAAQFVTRINEVSKALEVVSNGDLTVELTPLSDKDVLGLSLEKMTLSLNSMFTEVNTATSQVSTGANQVADGAQALAAGATEQAASIQQLSSSISEIAVRTKDNAAKASEASKLADVIKGNAEKGSRQMDEMMGAVKDINQSSQDISKVIKVIDDIAFQTNILALNAAVEAARAGQHGKGFAVVAEEVRNLAAKSAEAASDTESLIANSLNKAALGVRIADETNASLNEIVSGINQSSALVAEISSISDEQSLAISQINTGIDQVAQVVQQNSATAEESAAASEEMSSQSSVLQQLVAQFKIKGGAGISALPSGGGHKMLASKEGGDYQARGGSGYGKY